MNQMTIYHHLSPEERAIIMLERQNGSSLRQIAQRLGRSLATLSRELQRNAAGQRYCATRAGRAYERRPPALCKAAQTRCESRTWRHRSGTPSG